MNLKLMLDSLDGLDENVAGLYEQKDGKYRLKLDDGEIPDVSGLKSALDKERQSASEATKLVKSLQEKMDMLGGDEGLERLKNLHERLQSDERMKLFQEGKVEEYNERITAALRRDLEAQLNARDNQINELNEKLTAAQTRHQRNLIESAIRDAANAAGEQVMPTAVSDAIRLARDVFSVNEQDALEIRDDQGELVIGKDGRPMGAKEWLLSHTETAPHWYKGMSGGGSDPSSSKGGGSAGLQPYQVRRSESNNFAKVRKANEAAAEAGLPSFQLVDD